MHRCWPFVVALWARLTAASPREDKFRQWFPYFDYHWQRVARGDCATEIADFHARDKSRFMNPCAAALDCILDNSTESIKSNLANSQVVLGLTPTILSFVGSEIAELAVLAAYAPFLAALLSLGAPALQTRHLFTPFKVAEIVNKKPSQFAIAYDGWVSSKPQAVQVVLLCLPYIVAAGAVVNNVTTSLYLDSHAIVGFGCTSVYLPLIWSLLGFFPTVLATLAVRQQYRLPTFSLNLPQPCGRTEGRSEESEAWEERSATLADESFKAPKRWVAEILFVLAALAALLQLIFGTSVLSAMIPISFFDALPMVVRYGVGGVVCRALLMVELDRMRMRIKRQAGEEAEELPQEATGVMPSK